MGALASGVFQAPRPNVKANRTEPPSGRSSFKESTTASPKALWSWAHDQSAFGDAVVDSLKLDRPLGGSVLFAFTFGRGAWKTPLANAPIGCTYFASPTSIAAPAVGGLYTVAVTTASGCSWVVVPSGSNAFAGGQSPASGT